MNDEDNKPAGEEDKSAPGMKCEPGDVVALRSGGPVMTVSRIEGEIVHCMWFAADETIRTGEIPLICLDPADEDLDMLEFDEADFSGDDMEDDEDGEHKKKKKKKHHDED